MSGCDTNGPLRITNVVCAYTTNAGWSLSFDVMGGTNALLCDVFTATNLLGTNIAKSQWAWLERGPGCSTYSYTNQPGAGTFYVLGTTNDADGDGLTDAYERLVSKTDPAVGVNRIQSENAITGTTKLDAEQPGHARLANQRYEHHPRD